jgi:flagellar hook assembly protein FlgD
MTVRFLAVAAACACALIAPSLARAGDVAMRVQAIPLGARSLESAIPAIRFNMLAAKWRGGGTVLYRVHRIGGRWGAWRPASGDDPDWTGGADRVQFRATGRVSHLRAFELWSRVTTAAAPGRSLAQAAAPPIVTRAQWHANEEIVRARPLIAKTLKLAVVHHTAGTNDYTPAQSAAIVRGIQLYHVQGNGWNDIGYNFLVDRFGTIYEGRGGGVTRNVIGAHAEGFNTGTVGVSLIGNFTSAQPTAAQQAALVELLAWRLDVAHIDPLSTVAYTSGGNLKFRAGKVVTLHAISGHRDTGPTTCPGNGAYVLLPGIAKRVAATGLPKLYAPTVAGTLGGPIRFQARLSGSLAWTVTVTNVQGQVVARGHGTGTVVDWTWHSPAGKASYRWSIAAPGVLAASGTIGSGAGPPPPPPAAFTLTGLAAAPAVITPAPDGTGATSAVSFTISSAAHITAQLVDANGAIAATLLNEQRPAGANTFTLDASGVPDGRYTLQVDAKPAKGAGASASLPIVVDRSISGIAVTVAPGQVSLSFTLSQVVAVHVEVQRQGTVLATLWDGTLAAGPHTLDWDGTDAAGNPLPAGTYTLVLTVTDALGPVSIPVPLTLSQ